MSYFEKENFVPHVEEAEIPKGQVYRAKFISAGPVGYKDGVYLLPQHCLDNFAYTLKGCPVIIGHQDILDEKDMKEKAVGYVSNVDRWEDGSWFADFVIFEEKAIGKIENGDVPYVSCAYKADLCDEELTVNNVKYKKRIVGGQMMHLALVKNPRYNGTEIWKNSSDDLLVSDGVLYNQKDNIMFGFKKTQIELDKETLINTSMGDKTIEELVNELEAANAKIAEQDQTIKDLTAEKEAAAKAAEEQAAAAAAKEAEEKVADEKPADTDDALKKDLNNSLTSDSKVKVIQVPSVAI
jgi:hypothetical protein